MKIKITVPRVGDQRFKSWSKTLIRVDTSKANGYAFEGEFARQGNLMEVEVGTLLLAYGENGSMKYHYPKVAVFRVASDGLETVYEKDELNPAWALEVRDDIAALFNRDGGEVNPLAEFTDEQITAEARRRNLL